MFPVLACLALLLAACGSGNDGTLEVGLIESEEELFADGIRLAPGAQHLRGAVRSGLVALDENGDVVPALADRWNVTDDGRIFVFRLRDGNWPDGSELSAESARLALNNAIRSLRGTSLGLDLLPIAEIRAMAGRVIEIRTTSAVPHLLQILAQPELALRRDELETGVMLLQREDGRNLLHMRPPQERGLPEEEDWQEHVREVELFPMTSQAAIEAFDDGEVQVVLGGSVGDFPLVDTGPLSRGTVRLDPAIGLFGLQVLRARGMLESDEVREAVAMAIDREALMERFNIGGWVPTTRVVAPELPGDPGIIPERWEDQPIEELRQTARTRVSRWVAAQEGEVTPETTSLAVLIGTSPGHDMLFRELADQLATIGITLVHAEDRNEADLVLVDRTARYAGPRWFLNQFNCSLDQGLCDDDVDLLVAQALDEEDPARRAYLLAEAEAELTLANVYIPFGSPIRWSLVRGNVDGYAGNLWGFHPLPDMAVIPR